ncbi:hypothetical protein LTR70_007381 [Exophiala xenobiotica]|nr:hypothetical protein LTR70_007381 [Exophiala xenobiotica]
MTRTIALDYGPLGIHSNAICPGYAHTAIFENTLSNMDVDRSAVRELHPLKGIGKPRDVVGATVFLAGEEAGWVTDVNLPVDGGYTCR